MAPGERPYVRSDRSRPSDLRPKIGRPVRWEVVSCGSCWRPSSGRQGDGPSVGPVRVLPGSSLWLAVGPASARPGSGRRRAKDERPRDAGTPRRPRRRRPRRRPRPRAAAAERGDDAPAARTCSSGRSGRRARSASSCSACRSTSRPLVIRLFMEIPGQRGRARRPGREARGRDPRQEVPGGVRRLPRQRLVPGPPGPHRDRQPAQRPARGQGGHDGDVRGDRHRHWR